MDQKSQGECIAALDAAGKPLATRVTRADAHRLGIWHRCVSVFVVNRYGEILIERRSHTKDLFPGFYDIVGGHLQFEEEPHDAACQEIFEELGLCVTPPRLEQLAPADGV